MTTEENKNVAWLNQRGSWMAVIVAILAFRLLLSMASFTSGNAWLILSLSHCVFTLYFFHYLRGSMLGDFEATNGKYDELTFWEQIDDGRQYTPTRKFLTIIPVVLFMISYHEQHHRSLSFLFFLNIVLTFSCVLGKLPVMHRRRLFGMNKLERFHMPENAAESPAKKNSNRKRN